MKALLINDFWLAGHHKAYQCHHRNIKDTLERNVFLSTKGFQVKKKCSNIYQHIKHVEVLTATNSQGFDEVINVIATNDIG